MTIHPVCPPFFLRIISFGNNLNINLRRRPFTLSLSILWGWNLKSHLISLTITRYLPRILQLRTFQLRQNMFYLAQELEDLEIKSVVFYILWTLMAVVKKYCFFVILEYFLPPQNLCLLLGKLRDSWWFRFYCFVHKFFVLYTILLGFYIL